VSPPASSSSAWRDYGFTNWRDLKARVDAMRVALRRMAVARPVLRDEQHFSGQGGHVMRMLAASVVLFGLACPALAQERGSFTLDALTRSDRPVGLGYNMTDRLSVRPSLALGYSDAYGTTYSLGTDLRWDLLPSSRFSPYATAGLEFRRTPLATVGTSGGLSVAPQSITRYGGGFGVRTRVFRRLSAIAEGRVMNSGFDQVQVSGLGLYKQYQSRVRVEGALGLSYQF
jgi:hypothetical protein